MKRILKHVGALVLSFCSFSYSNAQETQTTPNVITTTVQQGMPGVQQTWSGFVNTTSTGAGFSGGNVPGYNPTTGQFMFGWGQGTFAYSMAINSALSGSGVQIGGMEYGLSYYNQGEMRGTLSVNAAIQSNTGAVLQSYTHNLPQTINGWTPWSQTQTFSSPHLLTNLGNATLSFTGRDDRGWAGYYGPQFQNPYLRFTYSVDQCAVNPQSSPTCNGYRTYYNMTDDGWAQVNLPFAFPYYGFNFTTSYMFTNGVIGFLNPNNAPGGYCCDGVDLHQQRFVGSSPWNFAIYALNTDLYPGTNSTFYTERINNGTGIRYHWNRVNEIGTDLENTFRVELRNTGYIGITYDQVNLSPWRNPLIGIAGDTYQRGYSQYYFGPASSMPNLAGSTINFTGTEITDICSTNPLLNAQCPGYAQAYLNQQCSISPLYNSQCPGYAQAFFTQQCSLNALYDVNCPGYATAYYNFQCSADPLYHTGCPGYEQAYFTQQCNSNPLYSVNCSGYATAYFNQQCSLNPLYDSRCSGYADAYYVQQCTANPLYDVGCTGYQTAYFNQQCSLNPLYNNQCPGYQTAFFNQQCTANALYDKTCPGYAEAYALKYVVNSPTNTTTNNAPASTTTIVLAQANNDPVAQAAPVISDPVINNVVTTRSTATNSEASPAAAVRLTQPAPAATTAVTAAVASQEKKEEKKAEEKKSESSSSTTASAPSSTDNKNEPKSNRQALAERRLEAARAQAVEQGKNLANKMGEAATMEAQVAVQNVVIQAMGFTPGFETYGRATLPDAQGYRPFEIYPGQRNIDSPAGRRLMTGSDRLHSEMIDQQYNLERKK